MKIFHLVLSLHLVSFVKVQEVFGAPFCFSSHPIQFTPIQFNLLERWSYNP